MTPTPPPTSSRRERPAKRALSRQWIVDETIEIMRREGLEKATMRRVAKALETGPASLYVYVANTAELHAAVLDELIGTLPEPAGADWQERLESLLVEYGQLLRTYPGLARSALVLRPAGPQAVRLYDQVLGLLLDGGIDPVRAAWGMDLLLQLITASAAEHSVPSSESIPEKPADDLEEVSRALAAADQETTPHVVAHAGLIVSGTPHDRSRWALRALVAGIAASPAPLVVRDES